MHQCLSRNKDGRYICCICRSVKQQQVKDALSKNQELGMVKDCSGQSPLLSLPLEVRKIIYREFLNSKPTFTKPTVHPKTYVREGKRIPVETVENHIFDTRSRAQTHMSKFHKHIPKGLHFSFQPAICLVNKQIRAETLPLYHHTLTNPERSTRPSDHELREVLTNIYMHPHLEISISRIPLPDLWYHKETILLSAPTVLEMLISYLQIYHRFEGEQHGQLLLVILRAYWPDDVKAWRRMVLVSEAIREKLKKLHEGIVADRRVLRAYVRRYLHNEDWDWFCSANRADDFDFGEGFWMTEPSLRGRIGRSCWGFMGIN